MKLFDVEGPLYKFMVVLTNIVKLNFCWILGTLIGLGTTWGVSTVAAFDVGMKMVREEEGYIGRQFLKAWKANFKQGLPLGLLNLLAAYVVYLDFQIFYHVNSSVIILILAILSGVIFATGFVWSYAMTARYANTIPKIMRNSFRISTRYPVRTVLLFVLLLTEVLAFAWNLTTWMISVLIGPAALILTVSLFAVPLFETIEKKNKELKDEE